MDHPDLIHPNACVKHKFCDDCILKAFTFSNNCPACVGSYGLIASAEAYNAEHNHTAELDAKGTCAWIATHLFLFIFTLTFVQFNTLINFVFFVIDIFVHFLLHCPFSLQTFF